MHSQDNAQPRTPRPKLSFRLLYDNEIALGPGKAELLEAINDTGSISAAGKAMNMSYRRAWMLVDVMNRCFKEPLVHTAKGGAHGGGAVLTPLGKQVLANYKTTVQALEQTVQTHFPLFAELFATEDSHPHPTDSAPD